MDVRIHPRRLAGTVTPPPSKSMAHRLLLSAALADGESTVRNVALSQDIEATLRCMEALGARWEQTDEGTLRVTGIGGRRKCFTELPRFDCGESGSTLRFLIPIAIAVAGGGVFTGRGRLMERPQKPYFDLFDERGIAYEQKDDTLTVRGVPAFTGGTVDGANDHRIVMAAAIAAAAGTQPVTIRGAEAVRKSYPSFWEEYRRLGGAADVL